MTNDYQPELDAQPPAAASAPNPFGDLALASRNYWAGRTGREYPPAPTFRIVKGRRMLGRYMDPFGCQCHMRTAKALWEQWYTGMFISAGIGVLFGTVDWAFFFVVLPILGIWYASVRAKHRNQYVLYYSVQDEIIRTGEPQWVPYDHQRLKLIDRNPMAVWP